MTVTEQYEADVIKPSTMKWLDDNGYEWKAEYKFDGSYKRIDSLATNKLNGRKMLVECKTGKHHDVSRAVRQLIRYRDLYEGNVTCALVYPAGALKQRGRNLIRNNGFALIELTELVSFEDYYNAVSMARLGYKLFKDNKED